MNWITDLRQYDYRLWILALGWVASAIGFSVSIPYIAIYFHSELGISMTNIGLFFAGSAILRGISQAYGGEISDKYGRYPPMVIGQSVRTVVFVVTAYAVYDNWGFWPIGLLLIMNMIFGAQFQPAANAMVADLVPAEKRTEGYSIVRIAGNFGWAVGPALGGYFAAHSYPLLFIISACMTLVSSVIIAIFLRNVKSISDSKAVYGFKDMFKYRGNERIFKYGLIILLMYLVVSQFMAPLSIYTVDYIGLSKTELGYIYSINGLMIVALQLPMTRLLKKFRLTGQLVFGAIIYSIGYFVTGLVEVFIGFVIAMAVVTIGELIISPPAIAIPANMAPPGRTGRYMGIYGLAVTLGFSAGPLLGGALLDNFNPDFVYSWATIAAIALLTAALFYRFGKTLPKQINRYIESNK